jgi:plasmid replication initiation protein
MRRTRTYLENATFAHRSQITALGGLWDQKKKLWYLLGPVPELIADLVKPLEEETSLDVALRKLGEAIHNKIPEKTGTSSPLITTMRPAPKEEAQADFFVPMLYDIAGKESRSTMDVAVFRLSKKELRPGDLIRYELSDGFVEVMSGPKGMASVWDYDIVLYAISHLTEAMNRFHAGLGDRPSRIFRPNIADIIKFCRKGMGGKQNDTIESALDRLKTTTIKIVRQSSHNGRAFREVEAEGLINNYHAISYSDTGKVISVEIEIPNWIYREVVESKKPDVLTVHRDYFLIDHGTGRFIYRLARRAAGKTNAKWAFQSIYERSGSAGTYKEFCRTLRKLISANELPEYDLAEVKGLGGPNLIMTYRGSESPAQTQKGVCST